MKCYGAPRVTSQQVFDILAKGDVVAVLALLLIAGYFGWWVYGRTYEALVKDRDYWRDMAIKAIDTADRLTSIMESGKRGRG